MSLLIKESQSLNYGCDSPWHDHHEHKDYWNGLLGNILDLPAPVLEIGFGPLTVESKKSKNYVNFNLCDLFKAPSSLVLPKCLWSPNHGCRGWRFQGLGPYLPLSKKVIPQFFQTIWAFLCFWNFAKIWNFHKFDWGILQKNALLDFFGLKAVKADWHRGWDCNQCNEFVFMSLLW